MEIEDKKQEFLILRQSNMSVIDYEREFLRLSRYASEFISTESDNCKRFLRGLREEIKLQLVSQRITEFVDLIERANIVEQVLGLDKKSKTSKLVGKRMGTNKTFPVDLLTMPFEDFEIILGIDWLFEHGVVLDCYKKRFSIQTESEGRVELKASAVKFGQFVSFLVYFLKNYRVGKIRWIELLKDYDCIIDYHPRKTNVVADTLSRKATIDLRAMFARLSICDDRSLIAELRVKPMMFNQIKSAQLKDAKLLKKREMIQTGR
ncbi:uncharacterized protein LOC108458828 [Gossypium arboreum]|uniref:uncharacterized protein LOC108458828 n=1 Tax=Gossypium arboreum TaxID=29729 RepID=UPI0008192672|nr:uncharacterized protein LOC108458828 [Gossypium arboreum]